MITNDQLYHALKDLPGESQRQWIQTKNRLEEHHLKCDDLFERFDAFYEAYMADQQKKQNTLWKRIIKWFKE